MCLAWDKMGPEFTYFVYYAKHTAGPWIRSHDMRLTDNSVDHMRAKYPYPYNAYDAISGDDGGIGGVGMGQEPFGEGGFGGLLFESSPFGSTGFGETPFGGTLDSQSDYQTYRENLYMINGLDRDTIYHVRVESNDKYHQWWYSYESQDSLGGGLSEVYTRPSLSDGDILFGDGPFGEGPFSRPGGFGEGPFGDVPFGEIISGVGFGNTRGIQFKIIIP